jgi:hypothetical protein
MLGVLTHPLHSYYTLSFTTAFTYTWFRIKSQGGTETRGPQMLALVSAISHMHVQVLRCPSIGLALPALLCA